jgi:hypothetical protein
MPNDPRICLTRESGKPAVNATLTNTSAAADSSRRTTASSYSAASETSYEGIGFGLGFSIMLDRRAPT